MKSTYLLPIIFMLGCIATKPMRSSIPNANGNATQPQQAEQTSTNQQTIADPIPSSINTTTTYDTNLINLGNYYGAYQGLTGKELKHHLHLIIRNHKVISYEQVWEALESTDECNANHSNIVLIYSMRSQSKEHRDRGTRFNYAAYGYTLNDSWNREHVWPKSHGFPNESDTAYTDLHHLRPADRSVNSARNTRSFDYSEELYFDNGGSVPTPCKTSKRQYSWEPPDAVKGDIARMMFYMTVRYEGPSYDLELVDYVVPNKNKLPILGKLSTLLQWHKLDPVDDRERRRNDTIYSKYQGNRNQFIDHPEFVELIWQ
jgi:endonuclease I